MSSAPAIGIDLGTTNSCAAIHDGKRPKVIRSKLGYSTIPSVLTFDREGIRVVGQQAERQMVLRPRDCVYGSKRLLGRAFNPAALERFQPHFAYELVPDPDGLIAARIMGKTIPLLEVSALILKSIRDAADSALSERIERAVMRTLGASRRRLIGAVLAEFGLLGLLGGLLAAMLASASGYLIAVELFDLPGRMSPATFALGIGGGSLVVALVGWLATRRLLAVPPIQVLNSG